MALMWGAGFGYLSVIRHLAGGSHAEDLGFTDQVLWNFLRGQWFRMSIYATDNGASWNTELDLSRIARPDSLLAFHVEPMLLAFVPLYALGAGAGALLIIQAAALAAGAVPAFSLARHLSNSAACGMAVAAAYLLSPFGQWAVLSDFHTSTLAAPLLLLSLERLIVARAPRQALVVAALAATAREDVGPVLASIGIALLARGRLNGTLEAAIARPRFGMPAPAIWPFLAERGGAGARSAASIVGVQDLVAAPAAPSATASSSQDDAASIVGAPDVVVAPAESHTAAPSSRDGAGSSSIGAAELVVAPAAPHTAASTAPDDDASIVGAEDAVVAPAASHTAAPSSRDGAGSSSIGAEDVVVAPAASRTAVPSARDGTASLVGAADVVVPPVTSSTAVPSVWVGAAYLGLGLGWTLLSLVVIHNYSGGISPFDVRYGPTIGAGLGASLAALARPTVVGYMATLLLSGGWLGLFAPLALLPALPGLALNALSTSTWMASGQAHYSGLVLPFVTLGAAAGLARLRHRPRVQRGVAAALAASAVTAYLTAGAGPLAANYSPAVLTDHAARAAAIAAELPSSAAVSASSSLVPRLTHRARAYVFPTIRDADYVYLDLAASSAPTSAGDVYLRVQSLLASGEWQIARDEDGLLLLQRSDAVTAEPAADPAAAAGVASAVTTAVTGVTSESGTVTRDAAAVTPGPSSVTRSVTGVTPGVTGVTASGTGVTADLRGVTRSVTGVTANATTVKPDERGVTRVETDVTRHETGVTPVVTGGAAGVTGGAGVTAGGVTVQQGGIQVVAQDSTAEPRLMAAALVPSSVGALDVDGPLWILRTVWQTDQPLPRGTRLEFWIDLRSGERVHVWDIAPLWWNPPDEWPTHQAVTVDVPDVPVREFVSWSATWTTP